MKFRVSNLNRDISREKVTSKERTKYVEKKYKFQNDSAKFSAVDAITANFAAPDFTTRQ